MEVILLNSAWKINLGSTTPTGCLDVGVAFHNGDKKGESSWTFTVVKLAVRIRIKNSSSNKEDTRAARRQAF